MEKETPETQNFILWVLIISLLINMFNFFINYRLALSYKKELSDYVFEHKKEQMKHHPLFEKLLTEIDELHQNDAILKEAIRTNNVQNIRELR